MGFSTIHQGTQEVLPNPTLGIRHRDLGPTVDTEWHYSGSHSSVLEPLENIDIDKWAFGEVWVLRGQSAVHHCWKNLKIINTSLDALESVRNILTLLTSPLPKGRTVKCQVKSSYSVISSAGESESMWMSIEFPQLCGTLPKRPILLSFHSEYWVKSCMTGRQEEARRVADKTLGKIVKRMWIIITVLWIPSRNVITSHWGDLTHRLPPTGQPQPSTHFTYTPPPTMAGFLCAIPMAARVSIGRWLVSMCKTSPNLQIRKRLQISALVPFWG